MRVLVIDDSRAMRMLLKATLAELGHEVTEALDGQDGLEKVQANGPFGLALVDWISAGRAACGAAGRAASPPPDLVRRKR